MNRLDKTFNELRKNKRKAFMPFISFGDPDIQTTIKLLKLLEKEGVSVVELGIPYSDPIADGPTIQASFTRALKKHVTVKDMFKAISDLRKNFEIPLVTMISYSLVYGYGLKKYFKDARKAGIDGVIVPDLPVEEADQLVKIANAHDIKTIFLVAPTTPESRRKKIVEKSTGFIYYISLTGTTGERNELPKDVCDNLKELKTLTDKPICIGFGISNPAQARQLARYADGIIVGSAIVKKLAEINRKNRKEKFEEIASFVKGIVNAIK